MPARLGEKTHIAPGQCVKRRGHTSVYGKICERARRWMWSVETEDVIQSERRKLVTFGVESASHDREALLRRTVGVKRSTVPLIVVEVFPSPHHRGDKNDDQGASEHARSARSTHEPDDAQHHNRDDGDKA